MSFILPKRQPPSREQQKTDLYRLIVARSDIGAAQSACELFIEMVDDVNHDLYYPLFTSIVVCYARPFTNNKPYGALPGKWENFEDGKMKSTHDALIKARHELIAHSDMAARKAKIVPPKVVIGYMNERELKSSRIGTQTSFYFFTIPMIKDIPRLTTDIGRRLNAEIEHKLEEIYGDMELPQAKFALRLDNGL